MAALKDVQIESKITKDLGGLGIGFVTFSGQPNANDILTIGGVAIEFDGAGGNINVAIGGSLDLTLDAAVTAINSSGAISAAAIKGANSKCLIFIADTISDGDLTIVDTTDTAGAMVVSAATMTGSAAQAVKEIFHSQYTITAADVTAMAGGGIDAEIIVAGILKATAPLSSHITIWDTTGLIHPFTAQLFIWRQVGGGSGSYGLFLEDSAATLQAGDTIDILAVY